MNPILPPSTVFTSSGMSSNLRMRQTISLKQFREYIFNIGLPHLRDHQIDTSPALNKLVRGEATTHNNNCLLDTIYQQIRIFLPKEISFSKFARDIRQKIEIKAPAFLSINDEIEGKRILQSVQEYVVEKSSRQITFDLTVLFADNEGALAYVDMQTITTQLHHGQETVSLRMIVVNYNHYEPLFSKDEVDLEAQFSQLNLEDPVLLPNYVINMPLKVDSDNEGSSSDEELDDTFPTNAFKRPQDYFRLFPKPTTSEKTRRGHLLKTRLSNPSDSVAKEDLLATFIGLLQRQAKPSLQNRISVCVGFNKMRSLSTRRNETVWRHLNTPTKTQIPVKKIGFLWDGVWQQQEPISKKWTTVEFKTVRHFYKQLKHINPQRAESFRVTVEKNRGHMVPYREIRDCIKNHSETKSLVRSSRDKNRSKDTYIVFLDSDTQSFRQTKDSPSFFEILDENYLTAPFTIASTGYTIQDRAQEIRTIF